MKPNATLTPNQTPGGSDIFVLYCKWRKQQLSCFLTCGFVVSTAMNTVVSPVLLRTHQRSTGAAGIRSETCKMNVKTLWFEFFKKERQLIIMWLSQQVG